MNNSFDLKVKKFIKKYGNNPAIAPIWIKDPNLFRRHGQTNYHQRLTRTLSHFFTQKQNYRKALKILKDKLKLEESEGLFYIKFGNVILSGVLQEDAELIAAYLYRKLGAKYEGVYNIQVNVKSPTAIDIEGRKQLSLEIKNLLRKYNYCADTVFVKEEEVL
jgi:hypothetical protein